jgi:hypothetical protein
MTFYTFNSKKKKKKNFSTKKPTQSFVLGRMGPNVDDKFFSVPIFSNKIYSGGVEDNKLYTYELNVCEVYFDEVNYMGLGG